jgi:hypothetical protein
MRATHARGGRSRDAMRHLSRLAAFVVLAALALPAAASAADPWSLPAPIRAQTSSAPLPSAPLLSANTSGLALAVADTGGALPDIGPHTAASVFADGAFSDPLNLTGANVAMGPGNGRVLPYASTRLIGAGIRYAGSSSRAVVAFGRIAPGRASLDAPRGLGPGNMHAFRATMAANGRGDASIVFPVCRDAGCRRVLVYLAVRRRGTSAFRSTRLADGAGPLPQVAVAVNDRGDAMAVWTQGAGVFARIRTAGGTLRARQRAGTAVAGQHLAPSAVLSLHRGQLIGWLAQRVSEGDGSAGVAWVAQARDGGTFTATRLGAVPAEDAGHYVSEAGVRVAYGSRGRALVAWTAFDAGRFLTRLGQLKGAANNPAQQLTSVTTVSDPATDTVLSDFIADPAGPEYVLMLAGVRGNDPSTPGGAVSVRASGAEEVLPPAYGANQPLGADAVLLSDGRVLAAWTTPGQGDAFSVRATPVR